MRKKFLCMLAMGVIAASLCACGDKDTEKSSATTPQIATGIPIDSTQENTDTDAPIPTGDRLEGTFYGWQEDNTVEVTMNGQPQAYRVEDAAVVKFLKNYTEGEKIVFKAEAKDEMTFITYIYENE